MRFALQNGLRIEATPGALGRCPGCGAELIAKCGTKKVWHWAHKGQRHCDHWWENETQWHREWKDQFPVEWQEIAARDKDGELHIADVRTPKGLVVEFQHSYLKSDEARKRTEFHKPMLWVVDGTRRKTDRKQFDRAASGYRRPSEVGRVNRIRIDDCRLLEEWVHLGAIVAFDFGGDTIWLARRIGGWWVSGHEYPKLKLVEHIIEGTPIPIPVALQNRRPRGKRSRF